MVRSGPNQVSEPGSDRVTHKGDSKTQVDLGGASLAIVHSLGSGLRPGADGGQSAGPPPCPPYGRYQFQGRKGY